MSRALEGITILDLTHMLSGPYGTMLLADMGARTIKIEPPERGEGTRRLLEGSQLYSKSGMGAYFLTLCRNKESVAIDLKSDEGREIFLGLVRHADIVVSNFGAGVLERLRIDYAHLSKVNPRIITCAISGFGETGPMPHRPAFDLVAQGMGGGMALTGYADGEPLRAGIPIGDLAGGMFGAIGVLSALQARARTGRVSPDSVSSMASGVSFGRLAARDGRDSSSDSSDCSHAGDGGPWLDAARGVPVSVAVRTSATACWQLNPTEQLQ